ncbi:MAG: basic secretory protein-like protein [Candidatus Nanoarchaeia archaeon]|nr:basic secretory protein-like protein [Candidatus Nanoarchaeia archaeon]
MIIYNQSNIQTSNSLDIFYQKLKQLFKVAPEVNIHISTSEKEFNDLLNEQNPPLWKIGFTKGKTVVVLSENLIQLRRPNYTNDDFEKLLKHELVHVFMHESFGKCPKWFDEGLACLLAKQTNKPINVEINPKTLITNEDFNKDPEAYSKSKKLVKEFLEGVLNEIK